MMMANLFQPHRTHRIIHNNRLSQSCAKLCYYVTIDFIWQCELTAPNGPPQRINENTIEYNGNRN